jgi:hypothetical protein
VTFLLFVSHSSPDTAACERLQRIADAVEQVAGGTAACKVLYDKQQISVGDDWRRRIAFLLNVCHGGMVLLDRAALASQWVHAECLVMSLRQEVDPTFTLVPVALIPLDEVRATLERAPEKDQPRWDLVPLLDTQMLAADQRSEEGVAADVVDRLRAKGALAAADTPAGRLADQLAPSLAAAGDASLRRLADRLGEVSAYLGGDNRVRAALGLVRHVLDGGRLSSGRQLLGCLGSSSTFADSSRRSILEALAPLPLRPDAAALLTRRRQPGGAYAHAALRCDNPQDIVPLFLRRAFLGSAPPKNFAIPNDHGTFDDLRAALREEFRQLPRQTSRTLSDAKVDQLINAEPRFVLLPGPLDVDVLRQLEETFPSVAFVVHDSDRSAYEGLAPLVLPVLPLLEPAEEERLLDDLDLAMEGL